MWVTHPSVAAVTTATFPSRVLPTLGEPPPEKARSPARPTAPHIAPHRPTAFAPRGEGPEGGAGSTGGVGRADEGGRQGGGTGEGGVGSGGLGGTARYGGGSGGIGGLSSYKEVLEQRAVLGEWEALARYWGGALGGYWGGGGGRGTDGRLLGVSGARQEEPGCARLPSDVSGVARELPAPIGSARVLSAAAWPRRRGTCPGSCKVPAPSAPITPNPPTSPQIPPISLHFTPNPLEIL